MPTLIVNFEFMRFNIRVYGLLFQNNSVLVSDELIRGKWYTKFPGGGLEFGEGSIDCLKREFNEELNLDIEVLGHFYTTDFFVPSAFDQSQIISVYYTVKPIGSSQTLILPQTEHQKFRWLPMEGIDTDGFSLVIDKHVAQMLQNNVTT